DAILDAKYPFDVRAAQFVARPLLGGVPVLEVFSPPNVQRDLTLPARAARPGALCSEPAGLCKRLADGHAQTSCIILLVTNGDGFGRSPQNQPCRVAALPVAPFVIGREAGQRRHLPRQPDQDAVGAA